MKTCWDSAFSNTGLEAGLPAFQLPMLAKCDALPKRDLCDTLQNHILKQCKSQLDITWSWVPSTPRKVQNLSCQEIKQCTKQMNQMNVRSAFDYGRLDTQTSQARLVQQQFEWFFAVNFLYPKFAVFAWSKQLMPVTVKFWPDFLVCGLQKSDLVICGIFRPVGPSHEAMKNSSLSAAPPEAWGPWQRQQTSPALHYGCIMLAKGKR